ncbi:Elongation of very long chain fatty acids protein [Operophtera brumata]|uniref:Elongation of very long chain fatty acids protein n=1 Tax=Operophtera brumata TaxID=104452 RepID=A0A0L7KZ16_OPEBR|nr:Elongation of very long chain fatty acids protein [Operophtera brumata]
MESLQNVWRGYHYVISDLAESPGPILTILASYLFFCAYAGPNYMKDRKPYQLKSVIAAYNLIQVLFSIFITYRKNNQVSFLHLYHHTLMPLLSWFGRSIHCRGFDQRIHPHPYVRILLRVRTRPTVPEIQFCIVLYLNVIGLFAQNCNYPKYLNVFVIFNCLAFLYMFGKFYIKSYIQFCIVLYLNVIGLFAQNCNYPKYLNVFVIFNCMAFLYMFGKFYIKSYVSKKSKKESQRTEEIKKVS